MPFISLVLTLFQVALLLLLLALSNAVSIYGDESGGQCHLNPTLDPRPHSVSILEFGAVGDGKTLNTLAFQNAIFYLKSFADKGGAQLYVPPGKWLTASFNLTSHLTLFLEKGAVIIGSQVFYYPKIYEAGHSILRESIFYLFLVDTMKNRKKKDTYNIFHK